MKFISFVFVFACVAWMLFICSLGNMSFLTLAFWLAINGMISYWLATKFKTMTEDEILQVTGYKYFEKWLGKLED